MDGSSVAGALVWFNTRPEEGGDRDIVLAPLFRLVHSKDGEVIEPPSIHHIIVSAQDIRRVYVSYLTDQGTYPPDR